MGLKDIDLRADGSGLAARLLSLLTGDWIGSLVQFMSDHLPLPTFIDCDTSQKIPRHYIFDRIFRAFLSVLFTGLDQAARGITSQSFCEEELEEQRESCPFKQLATKLGLPTNCDVDLRKQEELEVNILYTLLTQCMRFMSASCFCLKR